MTVPAAKAAASDAAAAGDRGSLLHDRVDRSAIDRRGLVFGGHVDDLAATVDGRFLRLLENLALTANRRGADIVILDEGTGSRVVTVPGCARPEPQLSGGPAGMRDLLDQALRRLREHDNPTVLVINHLQTAIEGDDDLADQLRDLPVTGELPNHVQLLAITRSPLAPAALACATGWEFLHLGLPNVDERRRALRYWESIGVLSRGSVDVDELASTTGGLELDDLRRIIEEHSRIAALTPARVRAVRHTSLTRQVETLMRIVDDPVGDFDRIAGGDAMKSAMALALRDGVFRVIGLFGPPGVGKTLLCNAAAAYLGLPLIVMDGQLKGGIVGETARNLARFREMLVARAPSCVFFDEIDLLIGNTNDYNGDSGASNEVRQAVLTLFQDAPALGVQVFVASNNPFSRIQHRVLNRMRSIPLLHPTGDDALLIARNEADKLGVVLDGGAASCFTGDDGILWNGRDIEKMLSACRDARAVEAGWSGTLTATDLELYRRNLLDAGNETAELNALEALYVTDNPYDLPWIARARSGRPPAPIPRYLQGLVSAEGVLDRASVATRLASAGLRAA